MSSKKLPPPPPLPSPPPPYSPQPTLTPTTPPRMPSFARRAKKVRDPIWTFEYPDEATELARRNVREINRELRAIHKKAGVDYPVDDLPIGHELKKMVENAGALVAISIKNALKQIKDSKVVDLCFLIDGTGSMDKWITDVKGCIDAVCNYLLNYRKNHSMLTTLRLALIVYRDLCDEDKQFEVTKFTENRKDFQNALGKVIATGGGDGAEDVFGGLEKVAELDWNSEAGTKIVFHLADSPCHGKDFHDNTVGDDHPNGDPKGRNIQTLMKFFKVNRIMYAFGEITSRTNIMIDKFSKALGEPITIFDLRKEPMKYIIEKLVEDTVNSRTATAAHGLKSRPVKAYTIDKRYPNWDDLPEVVGTFLCYKYPLSLKDVIGRVPFDRHSIADARVKIAPNPFDAGAIRIASYGLSIGESVSTPLVVKQDKYAQAVDLRVESETYLAMQTTAAYLAKKFRKHLKKRGVESLTSIRFIETKLLAILENDGSYKYYLCEPLLLPPVAQSVAKRASTASLSSTKADVACSKRCSSALTPNDFKALSIATDKSMPYVPTFLRFSNNVDYCVSIDKLKQQLKNSGIDESQLDLLFAFSHWTYEMSDHWLMVVDLQGVLTVDEATGKPQLMLTDPAIHCKDITRFQPTNLGVDGMNSFFSGHECNKFCKALKLQPRTISVSM